MFTKSFGRYVVHQDSITCEVDGFTCTATLHHDPDTKAPEDLPLEIFSAWANDEWNYFGVAVTVEKCGVQLTGAYDHALWGIEGNYPAADDRSDTNGYFVDVANDLLPDAIQAAKDKIKELSEPDLFYSKAAGAWIDLEKS